MSEADKEQTYTVTWERTLGEVADVGPHVCRGLTDRDIVRRLIGAVATSGPVTIISVVREAPWRPDMDRVTYRLINKAVAIPSAVKARYPTTHFCPDWDGMLLTDGMDELDACLCKDENGRRVNGR